MVCTTVKPVTFNMCLREYKRENGEEVIVSITGVGLKSKVKVLVGPEKESVMPYSRFQTVYQPRWR